MINEPKETFEFVEIPLPACFDLSKPYQSEIITSSNNSLRVSLFYVPIFLLSHFSQALSCLARIQSKHNRNHYLIVRSIIFYSDLTLSSHIYLVDNLQSSYSSDNDSLSAFMYSPLPIMTQTNETPVNDPTTLVALTPVRSNNNEERPQSARSKYELSFILHSERLNPDANF